MSIILMTTMFYKALILQAEIWCWSLLGLKGLIKLSLFLQASKKQLECVLFEKDELSLSLKSLQEEHNKILQQNEVTVVLQLINNFVVW